MKPPALPVAVIATTLSLVAIRPATATEYANNPNPACRLMRNVTQGAPTPLEPNYTFMMLAQQADGVHNFVRAFALMNQIDREGTDALPQLPARLPRIDFVIDRHLSDLQRVRSVLGEYLEDGRPGVPSDKPAALAAYRRAVDTTFTDDRGCVHSHQAAFRTRLHLAGMYIYGIGTAPDRARARVLFPDQDDDSTAIVAAIDRDALPATYQDFLLVGANQMTVPDPAGPTREQRQTAALGRAIFKSFGIETEDPAPWLGYLIASCLLILAAAVALFTFRELHTSRRDPNAPRGFFAVADILNVGFGRLDLMFKGLLALLIAASVFYSSSSLGWTFSPLFNKLFDYTFTVVLIGAGARGLFGIIEALRPRQRASGAQVHGAARPAAHDEAVQAARGDAGSSPLHDQLFKE